MRASPSVAVVLCAYTEERWDNVLWQISVSTAAGRWATRGRCRDQTTTPPCYIGCKRNYPTPT